MGDQGYQGGVEGAELQVGLPPGFLHRDVIEALARSGADVFRLRLSQLPISALEDTVLLIKSVCDVPLCIDTEGPQARCGVITSDTVLRPAATVRLTPEKVLGSAREISLRPGSLFDTLREGALVRIDPHVVARVGRRDGEGVTAVVIEGGPVESNAVVTVEPSPVMPSSLTDKDRAGVAIGMRLGVDRYGLSFASSGEDVRSLRLLAPKARIVASISSGTGYERREEIIGAADSVLVDRRSLALEFPLEQVPYCQREIVARAREAGIPVLVDVTLTGAPSVAEAGDIASSLLDGAAGLVVAAGTDPVAATEAAARCLTAFATHQAELASLMVPSVSWAYSQ
jgi:pyruvate kinase